VIKQKSDQQPQAVAWVHRPHPPGIGSYRPDHSAGNSNRDVALVGVKRKS